MKLPEAIVLLDSLRHVFPAGRQSDRLFGRVVASDIFGVSGGYFLVIKVAESDYKFVPKILEIVHNLGLSIKPMDDSWVIYKP